METSEEKPRRSGEVTWKTVTTLADFCNFHYRPVQKLNWREASSPTDTSDWWINLVQPKCWVRSACRRWSSHENGYTLFTIQPGERKKDPTSSPRRECVAQCIMWPHPGKWPQCLLCRQQETLRIILQIKNQTVLIFHLWKASGLIWFMSILLC